MIALSSHRKSSSWSRIIYSIFTTHSSIDYGGFGKMRCLIGFLGITALGEQVASLDNQMNSMGLFRSVKATEVMYAEGDLLCYKY